MKQRYELELNSHGWSEEEVIEMIDPLHSSSRFHEELDGYYSVVKIETEDLFYEEYDEDGEFNPAAHMDNFIVSANLQGDQFTVELYVNRQCAFAEEPNIREAMRELAELIEAEANVSSMG